jgi:hypothetical protein
MKGTGDSPPDESYHAHHIVAKTGNDDAAEARAILDQYGVDLNDPANGAWLPANTTSPNPTGSTVHSTLHTNKYYEDVTSRLRSATDRQDVLNTLDEIRNELERGTYEP